MRYRSLPSLGGFIALEAVVRHSSFAGAARELRVSQAAVSQQVKGLERYLGVVLVDRERPRIRPTSQGRAIAEAVRIGLDHLVDTVELARRRSRPGSLTVAATTAFSSFWLMPRLPGFHAQHPEVELRLLTHDAEIEPARRDFDVGILFCHQAPAGFDAQPLFADEIVPVCHRGYLGGGSGIRTADDLVRQVLLHHDFSDREASSRTWMGWSDWFGALGVDAPQALPGPSFSNYILLVQAAREGQGIAMGWRRLVQPLLARGDLVRVTDAAVVPPARYLVVMPVAPSPEPSALAFRAWLLREAAGDW